MTLNKGTKAMIAMLIGLLASVNLPAVQATVLPLIVHHPHLTSIAGAIFALIGLLKNPRVHVALEQMGFCDGQEEAALSQPERKEDTMKLRNVCIAILAAASLAVCHHTAQAQEVDNLYMVGLTGNVGSDKPIAGTALYAHRLTDVGTYPFTLIDVIPSSAKPLTVTTNIGVGVAQKIATIANVPVYSPASLSVSYNSTAVGYAYSGGIGAMFRPQAGKNWFLMPTLRFSKSNISGDGIVLLPGLLYGWGK
jgi:hypothetical protein